MQLESVTSIQDNKMKWKHLRNEIPSRGQRCIVWDKVFNWGVFAYWQGAGSDARFEEWNKGNMRVVQGDYWIPEPSRPDIGINNPEYKRVYDD